MAAFFARLMALNVLYWLDHVPDPSLKVTSTGLTMTAGGPIMNAAVICTTLYAAPRVVSDPKDEVGAVSGAPADSEETPTLLTALGEGPVSAFLAADLMVVGVHVVDATAPASSPASCEPAISSIIEYPNGRMVIFTNARPDASAERVVTGLPERIGAVPIDGHNPALAYAALTLGVPEVDGEDPFAPLGAHPSRPRTLDGGSWKEWLTSLLGFIDTAVVSEGFASPLMARPDGAQVAEFLRDFGVIRAVRTRGDRTMQYWWDGMNGEVLVEAISDASTLGVGDTFHGAFMWAIEHGGDAGPEHLIRSASSVAAVSTSPFDMRQWLTSRALAELVRGW